MKKFLFLALVFVFSTLTYNSYAQSSTHTVSEGRKLGTTMPFQNAAKSTTLAPEKRKHFKRLKTVPNFGETQMLQELNLEALPLGVDPVWQAPTLNPPAPAIPPIFNIEGMDQGDSGATPPDVTGEVSPNYYFQTVNASLYQIFDTQTGEALSEPIAASSFWADFNFAGAGDPIVVYDQDANRWIFIEFSVAFVNTLALAVSATEDPLGEWSVYEFETISFPDYPKIGQWQDSYFITSNEGASSDIPVYFLERQALLDGEASFGVQSLGVPKFQSEDAFQVAAPIDWDGDILPDSETGPMVIRMYDDSWSNDGEDRLEIWEFNIDWEDTSNSGVAQSINIPTSAFESSVCSDDIFSCLAQPSGDLVSALQHVIMNRPSYRKFESHESIVCTHVVDVDGNDRAGVRWYELRRTAGEDWSVYQEGTFAPDNDHRFMSTIAIDASGNIALAYAVTGQNTELSLRYTARRNGDPLGMMTFEEYEVATGQSTNFASRWGDYFKMSVHPQFQNQFWFTGEYMQDNNQWGTKIANFIVNRDSIDIGVFSLLTPMSDTLLTATEQISVQVKNYGIETQDSFWVGYEAPDGTTYIDTIDYTLASDSLYTHTFDEMVDMSVIQDYSIKLFTGLTTDQAVYNDTLRQVVSHLPRYDVAALSIVNQPSLLCEPEDSWDLTIANNGQAVLTSATINYTINGNAQTAIEWTGSLNFGETTTVTIPIMNLTDGDNTIVFTTSLPNGQADERPSNDSFETTIEFIENAAEVTFTLLTDNYAYETSWNLTDENGTIIYQGGDYQDDQTTYTEQWCLDPDGCYTFTIFDTYGDGMSYDGVEGSYEIVNAEGIILAKIIDPGFGFEENNEFCVDFECTLSLEATSSPSFGDDGSILATPSNGLSPFQYSINGGTSYQTSTLFDGLAPGEYEIIVVDASNCQSSVTIEVLSCSMQTSIDVTNESITNASDGSITINTSMGTAPYQYSIDGGDNFVDNNVFNDLAPGNYTVVVQDANGCIFSEDVEVTTLVGTTNYTYGFNVNIAPNPTSGLIDIAVLGLDDASTVTMVIFDNNGKRVHRGRLTRFNETLRGKVSLQHLPNGVYYIQFEHASMRQNMAKIIKQ